jgi:hypothetical protein
LSSRDLQRERSQLHLRVEQLSQELHAAPQPAAKAAAGEPHAEDLQQRVKDLTEALEVRLKRVSAAQC